MRRRLTVAMVLMVVATLILSGLVSLFLVQRSTVDQTRHELLQEAAGLATSVQQESATLNDSALALRRLLVALKGTLRLDGATVVWVRDDAQIWGVAPVSRDPGLPSGLTEADLSPAKLLQMQPVSGRIGGSTHPVAFAAVPYRATVQIAGSPRNVVLAAVLTRRPPSALSSAGPWFGLSALVILLVAGLVALRLGRRFAEPVHAARVVTERIAAGDMGARVPDPPGGDPELTALAASVNTMSESLARAKAAERHFLQSVSHDLRTPLTSIRGFAEAIEDGATADVVAAAGVIASEARRLERLVGDLLALATLEARRFTLRPERVDLTAVAAGTAAGFVPSAAELGLTLEVAAGPPPGSVFDAHPGQTDAFADPDRLAQVVANLIENALRHARTSVQVGAGPGLGGPEVWVADDGPGIAPDDLPKVFDRLYGARSQPDGARPSRPIGSGLGLTIVAELVDAMGGAVRAESPLWASGGTRMVVSLPAAPAGRTPAPAA
jgi:signal transduction histidine kinase